MALQANVTKLEEHLSALERLNARLAKRNADMIQEMADVGASFSLLSATETLGSEALEATGRVFEKSVAALKKLVCQRCELGPPPLQKC